MLEYPESNRPTHRELEVLKLIAAGLSTKQIAVSLGICFKTAACHRAHLMDKLGIHEIAGLTRYAVRMGYIDASAYGSSWERQEQLFQQVQLTYRKYKEAMDEYGAFLKESKSIGLGSPDGTTGASRLRLAERSAHQEYDSALLALKAFLIHD